MVFPKKNYASWNSTAQNLYELTDADIEKMHEVLIKMYKDISAFCKKHSIHLIAGGGTALGAVRHKGFIPWDDDMDLDMIRSDYEKFKSLFEKELGTDYELLAPGYKKGANCFLMRVYKRGTTLLNMIDEASPYPSGIYIDITPIDYAPNNKALRFVKGIMADFLRIVSYSVYWKQYPSQSLKEFMLQSEGNIYYRFRMFIGKVCSFWPAEKWFAVFDKFIQGKKSRYVTVAAGRKKYSGEVYRKEVYFPARLVKFEDTKIYLHHDCDTYLKGMYGNYMEIPPVEKREKHLCLKLDFEKARDMGGSDKA